MNISHREAFLAKKPIRQSSEWILLWEESVGEWSDYAKQKFFCDYFRHKVHIKRDIVKVDKFEENVFVLYTERSSLTSPIGDVYYNEENDIVVFFYKSIGTLDQKYMILHKLSSNIGIYKNPLEATSMEELIKKL